MGFLSKLGKGLHGLGSLSAFVPGIGTLTGAGLGGLGAAFQGKGVGGILGGAATAGLGGLAGGALGGRGIGGALGGLGNFAKNNPLLLGAGLSAVTGARRQGKADSLQEDALRHARARQAEQDKFRQGVVGQLSNISFQAPDLSGVFADPSNPFSRPLARPETSSVATSPAPSTGRLGDQAFGAGGDGRTKKLLAQGRLDPRAFSQMRQQNRVPLRDDEEGLF